MTALLVWLACLACAALWYVLTGAAAALAVGAAYVLLYALFYFWTDAPRIPWFSQCFDWPGNLCLPAGLVFVGLRSARKGART